MQSFVVPDNSCAIRVMKITLKKELKGGVLYWKPEVSNLNLRFYLRKTKGGERDVFLKRKQIELEVFPDGP